MEFGGGVENRRNPSTSGDCSPSFDDHAFCSPRGKMLLSIILALLALLPDSFGSCSGPAPSIIQGHDVSPPPTRGCDANCSEPFTSAPFLTQCTCVLPMKVQLRLGVSVFSIFPLMSELVIEIADGTFLKQSQVFITCATADDQYQDKTVVGFNLLPLGGTFDNTTVTLNYQRFLKNKVRLNRSLFGKYDVLLITYPGFPNASSSGIIAGAGPTITPQRPISANVDSKNGKMNRGMILVIASSTFVLLVVFFGAFYILLHNLKFEIPFEAGSFVFKKPMGKRFGKESMQSSSAPTNTAPVRIVSTIPASILSVKTFSLAELQKATEKFSPKRLLGEGGFGRVYHGVMKNGTEVAVKLLKRGFQNGDTEFISEVEMLSRLHHCNLVKLIGICIEECSHCLVYELVPNGSIESHLHGADRRKGLLDWEARLKIALGAARGLAYLHEDSNPRVIHRDFKAANVLLENDFTPKVSDFGLAKEAVEGRELIPTRVMGTFGYVAPEYAMTGHLLVKSDVYSYGVVLLELLTGRKPVDMSQPPGLESLVVWARPLLGDRKGVGQLADPALGGDYDVDEMMRVAAVAFMCVEAEVSKRPFMGEVVQALKIVCDCTGETCGDEYSPERVSGGGLDSGWLDDECGQGFVNMELGSSGRVGLPLPTRVENRSGPLRVVRENRDWCRFREGMSEDSWLRGKRGLKGGPVYESFF